MLAQDLWQARQQGRTISADRDDLPTNVEQAYAVQDAVVAVSGLARCGYKVGSTSAEAQALLGTDEPALAPLLAPFVQDGPARVSLVPDQMPAIEGEFAYRFGQSLPAREGGYSMEETLAA